MPVNEPLYPINLRLAGVPCLVVGGGRVALGKVVGLLEAGAWVRVVALDVIDELAAVEGVTVVRRAYEPDDLDGCRLAIAATDDPSVNHAVFVHGEARGVLVNAADDPDNCRFTLPARIRQGSLLVTFATGGHSPALAKWLRRRYAAEFGPEYDVLISMLADARADLVARGLSTEGRGWQQALDSGMLELIREGHLAEAKERLQACLSSSSG
ncbi:MAG TPA: bifunctional precorrin-2 dehydrogenase/sirohydrochlorin ferrochelatase [Acidimicrobiales bacterium]|jgi:precorrin-2 dehydrogenase/sirohydrochlorin ferrochelatase|nr:bifunctional precorrin-2 dehydrogenase/sirohydrochlorin ferrochelatase [Acidimicrobiales bacterium]